ncbi:MAG: nucleotidyltransferase family protein [Alphaproteobacteria bacterium]|nr:nucleotidyltransferase family protein [Alphaproteobacteria bacterium]
MTPIPDLSKFLSPTQRLLLAAATTRRDGATRAAVAALAEQVDWEAFARMALEHSVVAPVFATLLELSPELVPGDVAAAAGQFRESQAARNRALADELDSILAALAEAKIRAVPFKGPLLAEQAYGDIAARQFRDLDFLVPEADIDACFEVLAALDYRGTHDLSPAQTRAFRAYAGEDILFQRERKVAIEPHWAFAPRTLAVDLDYAALWRRVRTVRFRGRDILALSAEDTVLALAIHGCKEQWIRLQWICDFVESVRHAGPLDWTGLLARARDAGCLRMLLVALALGRALLGLELPEAARAAILADPEATAAAAGFVRMLFAEDNEPPSIYTVTRLRLALRERRRDRAAYAWRTVTTPRTIHYKMLQLPDPLFFLYRPAKLVHDYLMLPVWWRLRPRVEA